jgi:hypothetical protein
VQVCPTGSILRVDPQRAWGEVAALLGTAPAAGVETKPRDRVPSWSLYAGAGVAAAAIALVGAIMRARGHWVPWRGLGYGAGWAAGAAMVGLAGYAIPKRLVRLWMKLGGKRAPSTTERKEVASVTRPHYLLHVALGLIAAALGVVHAPHGAVLAATTGSALLFSVYAASASGLLMALVYALAPRALSRVERTPLLPEDFGRESASLSTRLYKNLSGRDDLVKAVAEKVLLPYAKSVVGPFALVASGRDLRQEERRIRSRIDTVLAGRGRERLAGLDDLVRTAVELRALPAQRALTVALRALLPIHIVAFSLALVLLALHLLGALGVGR